MRDGPLYCKLRKSLPPGIHFFWKKKLGNFGVPYFHQFVAEIFMKRGMFSKLNFGRMDFGGGILFVTKKNKKLFILRYMVEVVIWETLVFLETNAARGLV